MRKAEVTAVDWIEFPDYSGSLIRCKLETSHCFTNTVVENPLEQFFEWKSLEQFIRVETSFTLSVIFEYKRSIINISGMNPPFSRSCANFSRRQETSNGALKLRTDASSLMMPNSYLKCYYSYLNTIR